MPPRATLFAAAAVLVAAVLPAGTAPARAVPGHDWQYSNDGRQVLMQDTEPTAADPHIHVKFKRYGGDGQRQVRIVERQMRPATPWLHHDAEKLTVGEKAVYTTEGALPCEPEKRPLQVRQQMRIKLPGKPWEDWFTWTSAVYVLLDCTENP